MGREITSEDRVLEHCQAIRSEQVSYALMLLRLNGYSVELQQNGEPLAGEARDALQDMPQKTQIGIWSLAPSRGSTLETWQRDALKFGALTDS